MRVSPRYRSLQAGAQIGALFCAYVLTGTLGLRLDALSGFATLVWLPTGLSLAALLLFGSGAWPGVWLGAFVVNRLNGAPLAIALSIAIGNTLEAVLGALCLRRLSSYGGAFNRLRHVLVLVGPVAVLTTLLSATVGVLSLEVGGKVLPGLGWATWRAWWIGDALGVLLVAPLLLTWARSRAFKVRPARLAEAAVLGCALTSASIAVFFRNPSADGYPFDFPYVLYPLFIWAAIRFGLRGASAATALVAGLAIWGTARGGGPFARESLSAGLLAVQTFLGTAALTPLVVAGTVEDLRYAARQETFVAGLSHDLKSPLNALLASAHVLAKKAGADPACEHVKNHVRVVGRCVDRMVRLIGDMLDTAAIDTGSLSMNRRDEDAGSLVREAVEGALSQAAAKQQTVIAESTGSIPVVCDRERVLQVLSNLMGNAIKFTARGGSIRVAAQRASHEIRFSVQDNGEGIAPTELERVFECYWHTASASGGGTGLGLYISRGIVEAHSGRLWVESTQGVGSTFFFTLPVHHDGAVARPPRRGGRPGATVQGTAT
jgi:signal transduction histidine kinase